MRDRIEINKNTLIPVGLVITLVTAVIAVVSWTSNVNARIQSAEQSITRGNAATTEMIQKIETLNTNLDQTNQNVIKLQTQLEERTK